MSEGGEAGEETFVYWLVRKPKEVPVEDLATLRCPKVPRQKQKFLETSDGQPLEANFEPKTKKMLLLRTRTTSRPHQGERKKLKPVAELAGVVHIKTMPSNTNAMSKRQQEFFYAQQDPDDLT